MKVEKGLLGGSTDIPKLDTLLWGQINNNVPISSSLMSILNSLLLSISDKRVVVSYYQRSSFSQNHEDGKKKGTYP
jgi:hypothetical protein